MKKFLLENGRPDKPVACPRCNSFNTKFCYYNNYNVKQPRHFCRECQRYWTAGGSLRNVPVGAGRRKHKVASSKPCGGDTSTNSGGGVDVCPHSSLKPYHSLPFQQLVGSTDGIVQGFQSFEDLGHGDLMPMLDNEKSRLPRFALDMIPDSNASLGTKGYMQDTLVAEKLRFSQKRERDPTMDTKAFKFKHEHGPGNPISTSTHGAHDGGRGDDGHDGDAQNYMHGQACDDVLDNKEESANKGVDDDVRDKDAHAGMPKELPAEHDDSTCCSSVTAAITSTSSEAASEANGSSPMAHTLTSANKPAGIENQPPIWGPLMWPPWLWPFFLNRGTSAPGMMPQVDPTLALGLGAIASNGVVQGDSALTEGIRAEAARNGPAYIGPNILHWPYMWNPLAWASPWNVAWNGPSITSNNQHFKDTLKKQGSICHPKTVRMDRPDEAAYRSILSTLGVATPSHSPTGYFNAFQPKAEVFQPKTATSHVSVEQSERPELSSPHVNPAAQARSIAFQEGSCS